ncbi:MAG: hypothetical protein HQK77_14265 [Desulfobacterales bacterium]|nr:hypothetical protein [Desulfobacterales bacterium]
MEPVALEEALEQFQAAVKLVKVSLGEVEPRDNEARFSLIYLQNNIQTMTVEDIKQSLYILCER